MKKDSVEKMLNLIDDKYLEEASPESIQAKPKSNKKFIWSNIMVCACAVLLVLNIGILIPFLNRTETDDPLIPGPDGENEIINEVPGNESLDWDASEPQASIPSEYDEIKNKVDVLWELNGTSEEKLEEAGKDQISDAFENESSADLGSGLGQSEIKPTTDNQVLGVEEGDIIKRTSTHIFYLRGKFLSVYKIDGAKTKQVASYAFGGIIQKINEKLKGSTAEILENIKDEIDSASGRYDSSYNWEMFLADGGKTVNIITQSEEVLPHVTIISLNVENPESISLKRVVTTLGSYVSSRVSDGEVILFTSYSSYTGFFLPQYNDGEGYKYLPKDKIIIPESGVYSTNSYMVIQRLDEKTLDTNDAIAFYSYGEDGFGANDLIDTVSSLSDEQIIYASRDNIYITRDYYERTNWGRYTGKTVTEITRIDYTGSRFSYEENSYIVLDGYLNNQYSLDEKDGILRVVTSIDETGYDDINGKYTTTINASIYCVSVHNMMTVGRNTHFAPDGENVRSVRFDGDYAYVCTAVLFTDPVFKFNLKNPYNIAYVKTADISGYSTSLIQIGDEYLLGIGYGSTNTALKIEVYKEYGNELVSVDSYEITNAYFSEEYKSYFIDREKGLIGLRVNCNSYNSSEMQRYILLHFDGSSISEHLNTALTGAANLARAVLIGEHLMLFSDTQFKIVAVGFFDGIFTN